MSLLSAVKEPLLSVAKRLENGLYHGVCARLDNRKLFLFEGRFPHLFLDKLTTNSIVGTHATIDATSAALLNVKGRMISDALFYYRTRDIMVEVDKANFEKVEEHFYKKRLRENIFIDSEMSDIIDVYGVIAANIESRDRILRNFLNDEEFGNTSMSMYVDPRWDLMIRVYMPKGVLPPFHDDLLMYIDEGDRAYDYFRQLHGVHEGGKEMVPEKAFPLEANMHLMNGVSFNKGCYLGQELVARTFHTGEIRKHLFTLRKLYPYKEDRATIVADPDSIVPKNYTKDLAEFDKSGEELVGQPVYSDSGKKTGVVLSATNDLVVSMVRLEHLEDKNEFRIGSPTAEDQWQVIQPHWWEIYWEPEAGQVVEGDGTEVTIEEVDDDVESELQGEDGKDENEVGKDEGEEPVESIEVFESKGEGRKRTSALPEE
eukprot:TRINITY_DN3298_c0_g1_i1.p1 TRINITY_DN3298_c0_g1~~TRINITY_DN3298_c0_g1_i1.p1  ORF type:complete len:461 (-),score=112.91 TRINITY_DN3298_c0_g1_i1:195-1481(-)